MTNQAFRIGFVPGVMPDKWLNRWRERMPDAPLEAFPVSLAEQRAVLDDVRATMCFVRLPMERDELHLIPLYDEQVVVVASVHHLLTALDEVTTADLEDQLVHRGDPTAAIETVAAGTGVVVMPASVAGLHHRKDLTTRPLVDAPPSTIALAWRRDLDDARVETFVGIVRGRTASSSRGEVGAAAAPTAAPPARRRAVPPARRTTGRRRRPRR